MSRQNWRQKSIFSVLKHIHTHIYISLFTLCNMKNIEAYWQTREKSSWKIKRQLGLICYICRESLLKLTVVFHQTIAGTRSEGEGPWKAERGGRAFDHIKGGAYDSKAISILYLFHMWTDRTQSALSFVSRKRFSLVDGFIAGWLAVRQST